MRLATKIEAIFYIKGRPLATEEIVACLTQQPRTNKTTDSELTQELIEDALIELMTDYAHRDSALEIVETEAGYSLQLKTVYENLLQELVPAELGKGALRTLGSSRS